jgi:hypothetical protein
MKSKVLAIQSKAAVPEKRAKCSQISGHCLQTHAPFGPESGTLGRGPNILQKFVILICVLVLPVSAFARTDQASWENLGALSAGHKIQVLELNSKKFSGSFVNFSNTSISLQERGGAQTILRQDVRSVTLLENPHRLRNALIGVVVGTGAGAGIGAAAYHPCTSAGFGCAGYTGRGIPIGIGAVIGGVSGAIVGTLWPSHKTIFRAAGQ